MILAGDVGGTKTNLGFFTVQEGQLQCVLDEQYSSEDYAGLNEICLNFLEKHELTAESACLGIAGPCHKGVCKTTNLPWEVHADRLSEEIGIRTMQLINDLVATAYSILVLPDADFHILQAGSKDAEGNIAVMAAGTGLGEAAMLWDGGVYRPLASEGGHADFSPRNELEAGLLVFLREQFDHVAWERVLSGPGLVHLYEYFLSRQEDRPSADVADAIRTGDPAEEISHAALEYRCPVCRRALDLFVTLYAAEAGNLALRMLATGGVFIGGGIAPRILPALDTDSFRAAFRAKGRMHSLLEQVPVRVILTNRAALIGAAHCAHLAGGT